MKKRILAILCVLIVLVGVLAVTTAAQQETPTFRVGYAKVDINPWVDPNDWTKGMMPIALSGYGESYARLTKGWMDDNGDGIVDDKDGLKATCIAITDDDDKTILLISYDSINASDSHVRNIRLSIVDALNGAVGMDDIMISASHSHFSPDVSVTISKVEESMQEAVDHANKTWQQRVIDQMTAAAVEAMANRKVASAITKSETDASDATGYTLNGVRHYKITGMSTTGATGVFQNPTWTAGDNFGSMTDKGGYTWGSMKGYKITKVKHVTQANDKLYLMQFEFDDGSQPILFANWRGHTTLNRNSYVCRANPGVPETEVLDGNSCISGDYFNAFRTEMEKLGYRVSLVNGASGNINNRSRDSDVTNDWSTLWGQGKLVINGKTIPSTVNKSNAFGLLLSTVAVEGLKKENMEVCKAGSIRNIQVRYGLGVHTFEGEMEGLLKAIEAFEADPVASAGKGTFPYAHRWEVSEGGDGKLYTLNSRFHVSTIKARAGSISESVAKLELNAIMLGPNLAFVSGPGEMYDYYDANKSTKPEDNDWLELITQQYGTPFVLGYSNGSHSYIPSTAAFDYNQAWAERGLPLGKGSYGANISQVAQGGGEAMIAEFKRMLNIINDDSTLRSAKCEHCDKVVDWQPLIHSNNGDSYMYTGHYYLMDDIADAYTRYKAISAGETVCLDLNGHTIYAQHTSYGRAFSISAGGTLSIMDSVGTGQIIGSGSKGSVNASTGKTSYGSGGTIVVYKASGENPDGELNLYGGTIKRATMADHDADYGGTVYCQGVFNIYGGTVDAGHSAVNGGTIHMTIDSTLNMYGGTINAGVAEHSYNGLDCYRGKVNIYGGTINGAANLDTKANISGKVKIENLRTSATRPLQIGKLEEGSQITVSDVWSLGFFTNANGGTAENAKYFSAASNKVYFSAEKGGLFAGDKWYCECGGTKPAGHTCKNVAWKEWTSGTTMPTSNGNYYLTKNVTTASEQYPNEGSVIRLDMNGHDITFAVPASKAPTWSESENAWKSSTRVLDLYKTSDYVLTDSTKNPGTMSRDTSALTAEQISHITNWGVLVLINGKDGSVAVPSSFTMYNGILDGSDSVTTGGGIISVHNKESAFHMYGGTLKGGTAKNGGAVYVADGGSATFHGGTVTGGTATTGKGDCVYSVSADDPVVLAGNAKVESIYFAASNVTKALQIQGNYTGTAALQYSKVSSGKVIGTGVNASISDATIACANNADMEIVLENGELKLRTIDRTIGAVIPGAGSEQTFLTAQEAVNAYTSGWIILQKSDAGTLTIPAGKTVYIDLNGKNLTNVTVKGKLYVQDSLTDDFSVSDGMYGKITGTVTGTANAVPVIDGVGYVRITESGVGQSFHRVELWISGMSLNPEQVGISYLCDFRGDERIKSNMQSFGMALSLKGVPSVTAGSFGEDCEISEFTNFTTGAEGSCNSSTLLEGIMKKEKTAADNRMYAAESIYGRPYIKLKDGTTLLGETANYSLRDLVVMADEAPVWQTLSDEAIDALSQMYQDYKSVMKAWNIPNLKAAAQ